jgi:hypothetical protein
MKRFSYITILTFVLSLSFISCEKDFMEKQRQGELTPEAFYASPDGAFKAITAAYGYMQSYQFVSAKFCFGDICSDDAMKGSEAGDFPAMQRAKEFTSAASDNIIAWLWSPCFRGIYKANMVLEPFKDVVLDQTTKDRIMGEAKFIRAFWYFIAVNTWGDVPLITKPFEVGKYDVAKSPKAEVWAQIEKDFTEAAQVLPEKNEPGWLLGRATKGAALAYLAKSYLYQKKWQLAKETFKKVIDGGKYALVPDYSTIFTPAGENTSESVFEIQFMSTGEEAVWDNEGNFAPVFCNPRGAWGWGFDQPTKDLAAEYETGDPRKTATLLPVPEAKKLCAPDSNFTDDATGYYNRKIFLLPKDRPTQFRDVNFNERMIRYSDVLLMYAEACCELNELADAKTYLNMVRARARGNNPNILANFPGYKDPKGQPYSDNQTGLRNAIYHERRVELGMEGIRFYDLVRTGRAKDLLKGYKPYYPIPQSEIDASQGMITQTEGW